MDKFAPNGRDPAAAHHMPARLSHQHHPPPSISHQPHPPHPPPVYGNFNNIQNTYPPPINGPPIHLQRPPHPNPNMNIMQHQYGPPPVPPYNNNPQAPPPAASATPPTYNSATRPREWEASGQPIIQPHERDAKRMRTFPAPPNQGPNPVYPGPPHQTPFNRPPPPQMPPRNPPMAPYPQQQQQQHPNMMLNNPPIHPPNQEAIAFQQRQGQYTQQGPITAARGAQMPPPPPPPPPPVPQPPVPQPQQPQRRDAFQYPPKAANQYPAQPPQVPGGQGSYGPLPTPPRKDFAAPIQASPAPGAAAGMPTQSSSLNNKEAPERPLKFKDFLLKQPDNISSQDAQAAYDQYVRDFATKRPDSFFDQHFEEEWFRERYDPEYVSKRIVRIREEVLARAKVFCDLWDQGGAAVCAPELTPDAGKTPKRSPAPARNEQTEKGKSEGNAEANAIAGNDQKKEATAAAAESKMEPVKEDATAGSEEPKKEEGVVKKEEETVLQDAVKKDETALEGSEEDGKNIVTKTDYSPGKAEHNDAEEQEHHVAGAADKSDDKKNIANLHLPLRREHQKDTIFMRGIPLNLNREDLTAMLRHGRDGSLNFDLRRLKLGDINPQRSLERFGWAVYDSEETASRALEEVRGVKVESKPKKTAKKPKEEKDDGGGGDGKDKEEDKKKKEDPHSVYEIDCMLNLERRKKFTQGRVLPSIFATGERLRHDVQQSVKMMRRLEADRRLGPELNPLTDEYLDGLEEDGQRLDHVVTYLREVHYFCYYSGNEFLEDPTSMPPQELRPTRDRGRPMSEADNRLVRRIDERARWVLERDYDRPRSNSDNGEAAKEQAVRLWLNANTKHEGQNRYRCGLPPHKLFKGPEFVHKHLRTKHGDKMRAIREVAMLETYRANFDQDPSKDEVIAIFNEGYVTLQMRMSKGRSQADASRNPGYGGPGNEYGRPATTSMPMGMYNGSVNPMMMQPFNMMMVPNAFGPGYASNPGFGNPMAFAGRGMSSGGMRPAPGMMQGSNMMGGPGMKSGEPAGMSGPPRRPMPRHHHRDYRDDGHRGRRGGHVRRGGGDRHRGGHEGRPVDPRSRGSRRTYNDLDAPSNGPSFDLVRYDDV